MGLSIWGCASGCLFGSSVFLCVARAGAGTFTLGSFTHVLGAWAGMAGAAGVWWDISLQESLDFLTVWQP